MFIIDLRYTSGFEHNGPRSTARELRDAQLAEKTVLQRTNGNVESASAVDTLVAPHVLSTSKNAGSAAGLAETTKSLNTVQGSRF